MGAESSVKASKHKEYILFDLVNYQKFRKNVVCLGRGSWSRKKTLTYFVNMLIIDFTSHAFEIEHENALRR